MEHADRDRTGECRHAIEGSWRSIHHQRRWTNICYVDSISWPAAASAPDFTLSANPSSLTVNGGTNGTSMVTVTAMNGLNACYTLSASNLPPGVTAAYVTNPITGGASLLMLTASNNVVSGTTN